ncbi:MAG: extracellular solute-binding protein [Spirochaetales bacterium]|nr:extracellular solute-binding protein [Spirochaetales bacterium]
MKKLLILVMVIAVLPLAVFAGGQKDAADDGASEVIVVNTMGYGDNSNQEGISWRRIVNSFEAENPNIDIQDELLYDQAYHEKVVARIAAGDIPDLAYMGADARWAAPWMEANQQWDHKAYLDSNYYDFSMIPAHGPNGEIFEVPLQSSNMTTVLFMNTALLAELGLSEPKTYEDMVAMVPAAKAAGIEVVSIDGADGWAWGSCFMSVVIGRLSGDPDWVAKAVAGENSFTDQVFVDSLEMITTMVNDGVLSAKSVLVDYGTNLSNYSNKKALFAVQGHWAAGGIEPAVLDTTKMIAWPKLPGEKANMAGSIAAAPSVGYGVTAEGAKDPAVRDAALKFINYFYSQAECEQRLRDGAIIAPVLKNFTVPDDVADIAKQKVVLAQNLVPSNVIDSFLSGAPNDALNAGMQEIASGKATAQEIATKVESLLRN